MNLLEICRLAPVMPVLDIDDAARAAPVARAIHEGGLRAVEVSFRSPAAIDVIRSMRAAAPDLVVGAGSLLGPADVRAAKLAGAAFGGCPGMTDRILWAAEEEGLALMPGVATPSEAMTAAETNHQVLRFYPAAANGGVETLLTWARPLGRLKFVPSGGVTVQNAREYLALSNVACLAADWVAPKAAIAAGDYDYVKRTALQAAALRPLKARPAEADAA